MRALLILVLLFASLGVASPAAATADSHAHHHSMQHEGQQDGDEGQEASPVVHVCPGCAVVGRAMQVNDDHAIPELPALPANSPQLHSFDTNPIPPPPRAS